MPIPYPHRRNPLEARVSKVPETPDPMAKANSMTVTPPLYAHSYIVASGGATVSRPDFRTLHAPTKERGSFGAPVAACERNTRGARGSPRRPCSRGRSAPIEEPLDVHARVERGIRIARSGLLDHERNRQGPQEARDRPPHGRSEDRRVGKERIKRTLPNARK